MIRSFVDQLGDQTEFSFPPQKIVSLVPSQTELLADLGLDEQVVGITKFCVHPLGWRNAKTIIGGTKKFNFDLIDKLNPDLIVGNKEENYQAGITTLKHKYPVWISDIVTLEDAYAMMRSVGEITDREATALGIIRDIQRSFERLPTFAGTSVLYLIWRKPWMAAGTNTFINQMLQVIGLQNVITVPRYPELATESLIGLKPDLIFLSSEPYPFKEQHLPELSTLFPGAKPVLVDGEIFSWYGSRLLKACNYFSQLKRQLDQLK